MVLQEMGSRPPPINHVTPALQNSKIKALPMRHATILVGDASHVSQRREARKRTLAMPSRFRFQWHGRSFQAALERDGTAARLRIDADLGPVPFSLEDAARRRAHLALRGRSRVGSFAVDRLGRLRHFVEVELDGPPDGPALVTAIVKLLLAVQPVYDRAAGWERAA